MHQMRTQRLLLSTPHVCYHMLLVEVNTFWTSCVFPEGRRLLNPYNCRILGHSWSLLFILGRSCSFLFILVHLVFQVLVNGANGRLRLFRIEPLAAGTSAISAAVSLARKYGYGDRGRSVVTSVAKLKVSFRCCRRTKPKAEGRRGGSSGCVEGAKTWKAETGGPLADYVRESRGGHGQRKLDNILRALFRGLCRACLRTFCLICAYLPPFFARWRAALKTPPPPFQISGMARTYRRNPGEVPLSLTRALAETHPQACIISLLSARPITYSLNYRGLSIAKHTVCGGSV